VAKISIVGAGYVGLITGLCFSKIGHQVICVDTDQARVNNINAKQAPIFEKNLDRLLDEQIGRRFEATTSLREAVLKTDYTFIAVGTPFKNVEIDLGYVEIACEQIGVILAEKKSSHVVVVKSTVVPGTTNDIVVPILEKASGKKVNEGFVVAMNPEFLREGSAISDFMNPDRIVIGGSSKAARESVKSLYIDAFKEAEFLLTDNCTAEMIKYATNSLLATLISFSNEIGNLCQEIGIDVVDVEKGLAFDHRLSIRTKGRRLKLGAVDYLKAGCGFGGSCFPKDVRALSAHMKKYGTTPFLLDAVLRVNQDQPQRIFELVKIALQSNFERKKILILGCAFKPGTDDIRESPSIKLISLLKGTGAELMFFDPVAEENVVKAVPNIQPIANLQMMIPKVDVVVLMTMWPEFNELELIFRNMTTQPAMIDGRRFLNPDSFTNYFGIGRGI
jgi:UDPglucose 6-dehydrogenase/GDP-mannose 6-dehydrogenase